ncbi:MAG: hypothetical protein CMH54_05390 [Myxococcales bacterium]|nr:hypothetical protein [Myxococcales bacterium]
MCLRIISLFFIASLWISCAPDESSEQIGEGSGISVVWAELSQDGVCSPAPDSNDAEQLVLGDGFPADIDRLVIRIFNGQAVQERVFHLDSTELSGRGILLADQIVPEIPYTLQIFGCQGSDSAPRWNGLLTNVIVEKHTKKGLHILLTPEDALACPTESVLVGDVHVGQSQPPEPVSFPATAKLDNGNSIILGGAQVENNVFTMSDTIVLFHTNTGTYVPLQGGLTIPRAMANTTTLNDGNILVMGGTTSLETKGSDLSKPFFHPGSSPTPLTADHFVEYIDVDTGQSTALKIQGAFTAGVHSLPLMAATSYDVVRDNLFIVGGIDANLDQPFSKMIRVHGLLTNPGAPLIEVVDLVTPRVGSQLLQLPTGDVIVFGGNPDGEGSNIVEWMNAAGTVSGVLPISFKGGLTVDTVRSPSYGTAVALPSSGDTHRFLLFGGMAPTGGSYLSTIDLDTPYELAVDTSTTPPGLTLRPIPLDDSTLGLTRRSFFGMDVVDSKRIVIAGGIAGLDTIEGFDGCDPALNDLGQCLRDDAVVIEYTDSGKTNGPAMTIKAETTIGPSVGIRTQARNDGAILLTTGLNVVGGGTPSTGAISILWNPLLPADAKLCDASKP